MTPAEQRELDALHAEELRLWREVDRLHAEADAIEAETRYLESLRKPAPAAHEVVGGVIALIFLVPFCGFWLFPALYEFFN